MGDTLALLTRRTTRLVGRTRHRADGRWEGLLSNSDMVKSFLRGQNLEQIGRIDDATELYEGVVAEDFDSSGPYDRLIAVYSSRARHADVVRIATAALDHVHTHADKRAWYERTRSEARKAATSLPQAAPRQRR